ncbi:hypothetical protein CMI47_06315 [Candidatus Pacearchaeota archaeon]|nr:hypothetical protein [Candidatus Pacearchaeota archaeon]|tara:strand:+ start:222 stop:623 length:402 start_codon:yes stop_codon:yes gene_type:complete
MTVYVKESSRSVLSGLSRMKAAMIEDYNRATSTPLNMHNDMEKSLVKSMARMQQEFVNGFEVTYGSKYIRIIKSDHYGHRSMVAFVVGVDTDKKFRKGDILKPAGWKAPARNKARGNILDGGYAINWTGPLYL